MFCLPVQRALLSWLACASCVASSAAAEIESGEAQEQPYRVTRWTTDQGLPQNRISCLTQTRDGYLWLGTWFGLARFDGVRFTVFDKFNTPELVNDAINALAEDSDGTLWIATTDGLLSYRAHRFHRLTKADGLPDPKVWRLVAGRSGGVWVQAGDSVTRLAGGKFSRVWAMPFSDENAIRALQAGADGSLHIITGQSWLTLSPKADVLRTNPVVNSSGYAWQTGLPAKPPSRLWVGTQQGLQRWDQGVAQTIGADELGQSGVEFIYEDRATDLWVNTKSGGLFRQDRDRWTAVDLGELGDSTSTTCMEEDREGNLWLGTDQGLVRLQRRRVRAYTKRDGLADDQVWSVCEGTDGTIWVGTSRGLSRIQNGRVTPLGATESFWNEADRCVWPSREGGVQIAKTRIGVYEFRDTVKLLALAKALPNPNITALYEDRSGLLWIGTGNGVAVFKDGRVIASYTHWAGQSGYDVRCILEDRTGTFWFGTQGQGLTRLRDGKFEVFTERDGLSNNRVWSIHEDAEGALWLGTENGLNRFLPPVGGDVRRLTSKSRKQKAESRNEQSLLASAPTKEGGGGGRFFTFRRSQGLLENAVNWILEDDFGYLWLSGLRGIYRVKREQLNAVAEGHAQSVQVAAFGTADGMESSESNGEGQPAGWKARDGRLWFPTTRGVVVIDPKALPRGEAKPVVVIEAVVADGLPVPGNAGPSPVRLAPGRARLVQFRYAAPTFVNAERVRFRHRLRGLDEAWQEAGEERTAHFTSLKPGDYAFEVTAANAHGVWAEAPATFAFSLAPRFTQTAWFPAALAFGGAALAGALATWRLRWQRRALRAEQTAAIAEERARIARDLHDDLGTALTGVALELDVLRREQANGVSESLAAAARHTRALADQMREVVWAVNPRCDTWPSFAAFLEQQAGRLLAAAGMRVRYDFPEAIPPLPLAADTRHQLALAAREALNNVVRHSGAGEAILRLRTEAAWLTVEIADNGRGFESGTGGVAGAIGGHGLANLRSRLESIGGSADVVSRPGAGTRVVLRAPLARRTQAPKQEGRA